MLCPIKGRRLQENVSEEINPSVWNEDSRSIVITIGEMSYPLSKSLRDWFKDRCRTGP